tara:strand:+ start:1271 stop:2374 length:1104 start_codon:yes stop_codon:yes gene_type:complete
MDQDTFTMADVEAIQLEEEPAAEPKAEQQAETPDTKPETGEESSSFLDSFKKAKSNEAIDPEAMDEPKQEPEKESEAVDSTESRSAKDFRQLKEERDNAKSEITAMKEQLEQLKNSDVDNVLEKMQAERDELSKQLRISSVERHPEFRRKYDDRINQVVANAKKTVGEHNEEKIERLLRMDDSDIRTDGIEEIFGELSQSKQAKLGAMLAQVDDIQSDRAATLANANESWKQLAASGEAEREAHMQASNKLFDGVLAEAQSLEVYQPRDGKDEWNQDVQARVEQARNIFTGDSDAQELARASLWAAAGPKYRELLRVQVELNQRLQAQVRDGGGANPTVGTSGGDSKSEPKSFNELFGEISGMDVSS